MAYNVYALAFVGLFTVYIAKQVASYISVARFKKSHGCKPEYKLPQSERILGYGLFKEQTAASRNKELLEVSAKRYEVNGNTWSAVVLGKKFYNTIEPENIKAVLATNFKDFGLGGRLESFGDLLGRGIFTSDGAHWEHSRVSLFPRS